jgi:hypothetical protein
MTPDRVPALQLCLEHGWKAGIILVSKSWKHPRKMMAQTIISAPSKQTPRQPVRVGIVSTKGHLLREEYLYTFPSDVSEKPEETLEVTDS